MTLGRLPVWVLPAAAAAMYLASLSAVFAHESLESSPLAVGLLVPSLLAGLAIRRFWPIVLPFAAIAAFGHWLGFKGEDAHDLPVLATATGLVAGVALSRVAMKVSSPKRPEAPPSPDARAHRPFPFKRLIRRLLVREAVDDVLDRLRFRIDTFPNGLYQPVRSLPRGVATRGSGSESRWSAIAALIEAQAVQSAVDIGACEGYFSLELAEAGIPTIAIESAPGNYRTLLFAVRRTGTRDVGVLAMEITPENVGTLPAADCVVCLSIWHHFVRLHGLEQASAMLATIWGKAEKVMFFDTGETEMTPDYGLPSMSPDPRTWLTRYLAETCAGSRIEHLGVHGAFGPDGNPCRRNLFAVIRADDPSKSP